jgi:hypothetical protein
MNVSKLINYLMDMCEMAKVLWYNLFFLITYMKSQFNEQGYDVKS